LIDVTVLSEEDRALLAEIEEQRSVQRK